MPGVSDDVTFNGLGGAGNSASTNSATITVLSLTFTSGYTNTVTMNGSITVAGNFTDNTAHSWAGASALGISATSTITSGGKVFPNAVSFSGAAATKTLVGNWSIGALTIATNAQVINHTTAETLTCAGLTMSAAASGNIDLIISSGTWSGASALTTTTLQFSGSSTISSGVTFNSGTLKYNSGTITTTGSTVTIGAATTFDTNGMSFEAITLSATATYTINSLLTLTGTLTVNGGLSPTFAGTAGFTVANFTGLSTTATTYTFKNSVTYTVTTALTAARSQITAKLTITSDDGTLKAIITLNNGATCNVLANLTRIDANNGRAIYSFNGTITTCNNIFSFNDALPPAMSRVIHAGASY